MRPAGEVRRVLLEAAQGYQAAGQAATLRELAYSVQVGLGDARRCVDNMRRAGHLQIVGARRVDYRNRPVAEYAPVPPKKPTVLSTEDVQEMLGSVYLTACWNNWSR